MNVANRAVYNIGLNLLYQRGIDHAAVCKSSSPLGELEGWNLPFEKLMQKVFKKQLKGVVNHDTAIWRGEVLTKALTEGYSKSLANVDYTTPDFEMLRQLQANVWSFSCAADYQMVKDLSAALIDNEGKQRSFNDFKAEAEKIGKTFNKTRLEVEYNHAVATSQMASNWVGYQQNKDIAPNLKYTTVGDDRVRQAHKALNGIIRPIDDPFWNIHYPPNDWGCRCDTQAVDDEPTEIKKALPAIPKMFATNLAKSGVLYPEGHPYFAYEEYNDEPEVIKTANNLFAKQTRKFVRETAKKEYTKDKYFNVKNIDAPVRVGYSEIRNVTGKPHKNAAIRNVLAQNIEQVLKQMEFVSKAKDAKPERKAKYTEWAYYKLKIGKMDFFVNLGKLAKGSVYEFHAITDKIK